MSLNVGPVKCEVRQNLCCQPFQERSGYLTTMAARILLIGPSKCSQTTWRPKLAGRVSVRTVSNRALYLPQIPGHGERFRMSR